MRIADSNPRNPVTIQDTARAVLTPIPGMPTRRPASLAPPPGDRPAMGRHVVLDEVKRFCAGALATAPRPDVDTVYDDAHHLWRGFADLGIANWWVPRSHGGLGVSLVESVEIVAELAYWDPGFAFAAFLPILPTRMVELFAPDSLAVPLLRDAVAGATFSAAAASELQAGSELLNTRTRVRRVGNDLVIDGEKEFSTNFSSAAFVVVLAHDADEGRYSTVVVPANTPGITVVRRWRMSGLHGTGTYAARFERCAVPMTNELRGNGLRILEVGLNASRILMASTAIGMVRRLRDLCLDYAERKVVGGAPLNTNAIFIGRLGQIEMELDTIIAQCMGAARDYDALYTSPDGERELYRQGVLKSAIVAKMHCGQLGWRIASVVSEMFGGHGYTEDHRVHAIMRSLRHISIVEGGDDVLREVMFRRFMKGRRPVDRTAGS